MLIKINYLYDHIYFFIRFIGKLQFYYIINFSFFFFIFLYEPGYNLYSCGKWSGWIWGFRSFLIFLFLFHARVLRARLVEHLSNMFSIFKQHYTHFHTLFYPHVFQKNKNNIIQTPLPDRPLIFEKEIFLSLSYIFVSYFYFDSFLEKRGETHWTHNMYYRNNHETMHWYYPISKYYVL